MEEVRMTLVLPKELKKKIHRRAISEELTLSDMINKVIKQYLDNVNKEEGEMF